MAENSKIEWCDHTFNPWIGCTKVSPACDRCYAEMWDSRFNGARWGPHAVRTRTRPGSWNKPRRWNANHESFCVKHGRRQRVFCASLADIFDNHKSIQPEWRDDLWKLIRETPNLDWQLLTKRPQNIARFLPEDWGDGYDNVWLGTTAENEVEFVKRTWCMKDIPAVVRFLSCEPLLGSVPLWPGTFLFFHWVIAGGESGPNFREMNIDHARALRDQCVEQGIPFFFKQYSGATTKAIKAMGRELDGKVWNEFPETSNAA